MRRSAGLAGIETASRSAAGCMKASPELYIAAEASWRNGYAADCKSVYTGSIPVLASIDFEKSALSSFASLIMHCICPCAACHFSVDACRGNSIGPSCKRIARLQNEFSRRRGAARRNRGSCRPEKSSRFPSKRANSMCRYRGGKRESCGYGHH